MKTRVHLQVYGSLRRQDAGGEDDGLLAWEPAGPAPLSAVLDQAGISRDRVQLAMVNHRACPLDTVVGPGDRVALFPREYPFFADWNGFRNKS